MAQQVRPNAGPCGSIVRVGSGGVGLRSNVKASCTPEETVAVTAHKLRVGPAIKYGSLQVSTYAVGSPTAWIALQYYINSSGKGGHRSKLGSATRWYTGDRVDLGDYINQGFVVWATGTGNGNWYDVARFKVKYTVTVLQ